ncbi:ribose-5-phosphate isomerase RpiA [Halosegnis marinus]|uniref:Ribose-5-phosphate isomerase A n=1 Tax=Halosegnis marinus TaxID=3034023 RepID=A0ABD5ZN96_9EURY|nr:ribose-5-phosphate isomerase RpiA [Halosegnis sp. DT85]
MKRTGGSDAAKRRAGEAAADRVTDGQVVGLGTGSTAAHAIRALGRAADSGLDVRGIPTSFASRQLAREVGVPLTTLEEATPDVAIDGADEVCERPGGFDLVKGGGAAHTREKYVDSAADDLLVVADPSKLADPLAGPIPVAVVPDARPVVAAAVRELGGEPTLRAAEHKDGPVVTDDGNLVLDCAFDGFDPDELSAALSATPGVVEHGLFCGLADAVFVGTEDGVEVLEASPE